jgi:hypothetical protein
VDNGLIFDFKLIYREEKKTNGGKEQNPKIANIVFGQFKFN